MAFRGFFDEFRVEVLAVRSVVGEPLRAHLPLVDEPRGEEGHEPADGGACKSG